MTLGDKRRIEHAKSVLAKHPEYLRAALARAYRGERTVANLVRELAWLRAFARGLDDVVMEHLVSNGYVASIEERRYGITAAGLKLLGKSPSRPGSMAATPGIPGVFLLIDVD